ncbi:Immunity protein 51 [Moraxella cuniculi DSM 21768]|uniref:Immunity protein 51 n=2 Tax=Moraxella cuniculi TaxID=34061 RepID=A0A1N7ES89_9GAMM|nr:Imm51 family immunity protein [Moraxella cuniculi]SIR90988.1 Immunity protein 51 [Moraxella cuniculi DSM 21768]VEG13388.1 Uncharacterised protein [Moraxella cuniculi]
MSDFKNQITPFKWIEHEDSVSVIMSDVGDYKQHIFDNRADEDFEGNGYDWQSLAVVFLDEKMPHLTDKIHFDSESSMFCVWANHADTNALKEFIIAFKNALDDNELILDLFSRAELD